MSTQLRTIKAILYPNPMKNAKGRYLARTSKYTSYNIREICELAKEKTGVANADALEYYAKLFLEQMLELVENGNKINTGYFTAQANVKGSFNSLSDSFDAEKHSVDIVFSASKLTRQRAKKLKVKILHINPFIFGIQSVIDGQTGLHVSKLVMNRLLIISGAKVKITGDDPSVGVYFINTETGSEMHLHATEFHENGNATLKLFVPELPSGSYQLKIVTQYAGNTVPLAQARSSTFPNLLSVD